ncbi:MAG: glutamate--tRNA ligase [Alphaproteobacteria bacterium]|jgi:glutamyl-tRNA synthetase|nr:glutamate--tRNA ligase [Rhodospirillaceae bacterium]MDP6404181.1 glutamate--tRNA ligase [Alphaproteobacteria bacterium]MDP6621592.1 glutamate--tRNA ligase [Alphaproteobacteria bacterium]
MTVITRFAPSPTGTLHIGGARTALFNWLFARHHGGRFLLRVEDTDRARSTEEAVAAIFDGLEWLGLDWDDEPVFQASRQARHVEVAEGLLAAGRAYHCFCTPDELKEMREQARAEGRPVRYDGRWRDRDPAEAPAGVPPVVRLRAPREGDTTTDDLVQGEVRVANRQLDDMVLLRSDATPTYMLSVVVDDHDEAITHIIRGDDHLDNAARQSQLYQALDWQPPRFAHIPLIHGADGAKLSKRHGALGVTAYREQGYLPEAICNYLLRLGWGHGDDEVISRAQAIEWFDLDNVGKAAARFDFDKLANLNGQYLQQADDGNLLELMVPGLEAALDRKLEVSDRERLLAALEFLKPRAKLISDLVDKSLFLCESRPLIPNPKAAKLLSPEGRQLVQDTATSLSSLRDWTTVALEEAVRTFAEARELKLGKVAQPLRAALTGRTESPGIFDVLVLLGRDESLARLGDAGRGQ